MLPKEILEAIKERLEKDPQSIFNAVIDYNILETIERKYDEGTYDNEGYLYFKAKDKFFKVRMVDPSYGNTSYPLDSVEEVQPKTKTVTYFE